MKRKIFQKGGLIYIGAYQTHRRRMPIGREHKKAGVGDHRRTYGTVFRCFGDGVRGKDIPDSRRSKGIFNGSHEHDDPPCHRAVDRNVRNTRSNVP